MRQPAKRPLTSFLILAFVAIGCLCWVQVLALGVEYYWPHIVDVRFDFSSYTEQFNPRGGNIAINDEGTIAVVWTSNNWYHTPFAGHGFLRLINGRGNNRPNDRLIVSKVPGNVKYGSVVTGSSLDFFCQFSVNDDIDPGGPHEIRLLRVDALGHSLWDEDGVTLRYGRPEDPMLVSDAQGGVIVSFIEAEQSFFLCQRFHPSGRALYGTEPVPISIDHGPFINPVAIPDRFGGMFAFWMDPSAPGVIGQHISASGARLWGDSGMPLVEDFGTVHTSIGHTYFKVIPTSDMSFVIAYESIDPISGVPVIRAQKFRESGHPVWQDSIRFDQRPIQQYLGGLTPGPHGSFFYTGSTADDAIISRIGANGAEQWKVVQSDWSLRFKSIDYANGVVAVTRWGSGRVLAWTGRGEIIPPEHGAYSTGLGYYHTHLVETAVHPNRSILTLYHGYDKFMENTPAALGFFWLLEPPAPRLVSGRRP